MVSLAHLQWIDLKEKFKSLNKDVFIKASII